MHVEEKQLGAFAVDSGLISKSGFQEAAKTANESGKPIEDVLVERGDITGDDLRRMQAYILGIPFINLKDQKIPFEILSMIPEPIARKHNIIPFSKTDKGIEVAMLDTDDLAAIDFVKKKTGRRILPRLTDRESVKYALQQYQKTLKDEFGDIIKKESDSLTMVAEAGGAEGEEVSASDLKKMAEDLPVVRVVDALLKHAIIQNASDIHVEPMENQVLVRYRIDGILHDAMTLPKSASDSIAARIKVLANLKLDEKRLPQDGRFKVEANEEKVSLRVSVLPTYYGEKVVMRLLRENISGFTLEGLGFHGDGLEALQKGLRSKTGLLLTTGPTGSGKTTTLYTMLDILNTTDVNISTVEDPVEYQMARINQTQVKPSIGFTFAEGLRSLVRQDPDVIMVGEIRDNETASLAVNAALTGHLVLSTLHTNSAAGAIPRLLEMDVEPFLLVSTLEVIIAQRLVRKLCDEKSKKDIGRAGLEQLAEHVNLDRVMENLVAEGIYKKGTSWNDVTFYDPKSTAACEDGYSGRLGIYEILPVTPAIKDLIMQGATTEHVEKAARDTGMMTMLEDGIYKAAQGLTTIDEVLRVINE